MIELQHDRDKIRESKLLGVLKVRGYVTVRNRNAWHSTTSRRYQGTSSLSLDMDSAARVAENWRKQGSEFVVIETPGIGLLTSGGLILSVDFHAAIPFDGLNLQVLSTMLRIGADPMRALTALSATGVWKSWDVAPDPNSIVQGFDPWISVDGSPIDGSDYPAHRSFSDGSRYALGWRASSTSTSPHGVDGVVAAFQAQHPGYDQQYAIHEHNRLRESRVERLMRDMKSGADDLKDLLNREPEV